MSNVSNLSNTGHAHPLKTVVPDFKIDAISREVIQVTDKVITLMQFDHNSEKLRFECPRYVDGHDMSLCDKVEVHFVNAVAASDISKAGKYTVVDLEINEDNPELVNFSWVVSRNATEHIGTLVFSVRFTCLNGTEIEYAWHTSAFSFVSVDQGLVNELDESYDTLYLDNLETKASERIEQITTATLDRAIEALENSIVNDVQSLGARMDTFTKLAEGSTTGDAELIDIRVGVDGSIYESAGTAVREQFVAVDKKLSLLGEFEADTSGWEPVNVIDGYSWGEAGYTYDNYGNIVSTEYTKQFTPLTELVPVVPGASYKASGFVGQIRIYTSDKVQLDLIYNNAMSNQLSFTAPETAAYFGIYYRHDVINTEEKLAAIRLFRTTLTAEEYRACPVVMVRGRISGEYITDNSISNDKLSDDVRTFISPLAGKTIVNFGDSIFGNARPPEDISTYIATMTGATVHNCGFGGCRMSYHPSENYDAFSMTKLADAISNNDFSLQDTAISNKDGDSVPGYFTESVELLKSINFDNVDIITIAYGANDFNGVTLDNTNDKRSTRTFAGALRYSIETILTAYPHIRIFVCSPTYRFWMNDSYEFVEDSDTKKGGAYYLVTDIVEKAKEVAAEYKLPYIDNYHSVGINKFNRTTYFPATDGAHHNINGRKTIAAHIAKELF